MNSIDSIIREEVRAAIDEIKANATNPQEILSIAQMATDLAMLPMRMARGEDVTAIAASLKAESLNRGVAQAAKAQAAAANAWMNIVVRLAGAAVTGALA